MSIQSQIGDILSQLCDSNNNNLECIKELTIESYKDVTNTDLPIMVRILSDYTLIGKADAEDRICDMLLGLTHRGMSWRHIISKMSKVTVLEQIKAET